MIDWVTFLDALKASATVMGAMLFLFGGGVAAVAIMATVPVLWVGLLLGIVTMLLTLTLATFGAAKVLGL